MQFCVSWYPLQRWHDPVSQLSLEGGHSLEREESQWGYRSSALPTPAPPPSCSGHSGKISPASEALEGVSLALAHLPMLQAVM